MDVRRKYSLTSTDSRESPAQNPVISDIMLIDTDQSTSNVELKVDSTNPENGELEIPLALASLLTQSDASGNQIIIDPPTTYEAIPSPNSPTSKSAQKFRQSFPSKSSSSTEVVVNPSNATSPEPNSPNSNIFRYLLCRCFDKNKDKSISTTQTKNRNWTTKSPSNRNSSNISLTRVGSSSRPKPAIMPKLGDISAENRGKKCLALDLDETLVHSSFQPVKSANYIIPVNIDGTVHNVYVLKRPGVDEFLRKVSLYYEIVIYTASLSKYADPLLDELDKDKLIYKRFFRENCVFYQGHYVKDLSLFENRDITQTIIVDNSPMSYIFHPENAIDCSSFIDNPNDTELWQIADFLVSIKDVENVKRHCRNWREWCSKNPSKISEE